VIFNFLTKIPFCNHIMYFYTTCTLENREQFLICLLTYLYVFFEGMLKIKVFTHTFLLATTEVLSY